MGSVGYINVGGNSMESKVIQQFLGEIDGVKFDKENVYYSSEHILSKLW